jgi:glyoxylate carboligase
MKVSDAIADILRREGVETIIGYPVNHILERGAAAGIRPIIVRQERTGLHMADAMSRVTSGKNLGVFVMQHTAGKAEDRALTVIPRKGGSSSRRTWVLCRTVARHKRSLCLLDHPLSRMMADGTSLNLTCKK